MLDDLPCRPAARKLLTRRRAYQALAVDGPAACSRQPDGGERGESVLHIQPSPAMSRLVVWVINLVASGGAA